MLKRTIAFAALSLLSNTFFISCLPNYRLEIRRIAKQIKQNDIRFLDIASTKFAKMGPSAIPELKRTMLNHKDWNVRLSILLSFHKMQPRTVAAARAVHQMMWKEEDKSLKSKAFKLFSGFPSKVLQKVLPQLFKKMSHCSLYYNPSYRIGAYSKYRHRIFCESFDAIANKIYESIIPMLYHKNWHVRSVAVDVFGKIKGRKPTRHLLRILDNLKERPMVKYQTMRVLIHNDKKKFSPQKILNRFLSSTKCDTKAIAFSFHFDTIKELLDAGAKVKANKKRILSLMKCPFKRISIVEPQSLQELHKKLKIK
jgi:hypothetical protein